MQAGAPADAIPTRALTPTSAWLGCGCAPAQLGRTDVTNFDKSFTSEPAVLTPVTHALSAVDQEEFDGFDYVAPWVHHDEAAPASPMPAPSPDTPKAASVPLPTPPMKPIPTPSDDVADTDVAAVLVSTPPVAVDGSPLQLAGSPAAVRSARPKPSGLSLQIDASFSPRAPQP